MASPLARAPSISATLAPADVAALLGDWPARGTGSLAARLAFSLRSRILADLLPPGTLLPPERVLAEALSVSRSTLVAALDRLRAEGLVVSRQGSGTRIADPPGTDADTFSAVPGGHGAHPAGTGSRDHRPLRTGSRDPGPTSTGTRNPRLLGTGSPDAGPVGTGRDVSGRAAGRRRGTAHGRGALAPTMAARLLGAAERGINFGISAPPAAGQLPPLAVTSTDLLATVPAHGYEPAGLAALRAALADRHSTAGLPTAVEQIEVTHGAQHAIDLALAMLCSPGDAVAVEDPTYPGVLDVLAARGLRPVVIAADGRGPTPAGLEAAARHGGARVAFLLPAVHNPTGRVLDPGRRQALARTLDKLEMVVVEDNTLADLTYDAGPVEPRPSHRGPVLARQTLRPVTAQGAGDLPAGPATQPPDRPGGRPLSLAAPCRRATVVSVETTSKVAWGGLRVGWLRAPAGLIERSVQLRTSSDLGVSVPAQLLALQLLERYDEVIAARRQALRASAAWFTARLTEAIPGATFDPPAGGLSVWVRLPGGADAAAFASRALRHGVSVAPGHFASPTGGHDCLRLCHDRPDEEITEGMARLAAAWSETTPPRPLP